MYHWYGTVQVLPVPVGTVYTVLLPVLYRYVTVRSRYFYCTGTSTFSRLLSTAPGTTGTDGPYRYTMYLYTGTCWYSTVQVHISIHYPLHTGTFGNSLKMANSFDLRPCPFSPNRRLIGAFPDVFRVFTEKGSAAVERVQLIDIMRGKRSVLVLYQFFNVPAHR